MRRRTDCRWIAPQDFRDLRRHSGMTRCEAAKALDVTSRTVQNWETGGARIPWMAYRLLRILNGHALPGVAWEGWSVCGDRLYAANGRWFDANSLEQIEQVFAMARLWRQDYARRYNPPSSVVLPFPERRPAPREDDEDQEPFAARSARIGGVR